MKTITVQRVSTRGEDYGHVLEEFSFDVDDDDEGRVAWKPVGYVRSESMGMSGSDFVLPQVLALIAMVLAVLAFVI